MIWETFSTVVMLITIISFVGAMVFNGVKLPHLAHLTNSLCAAILFAMCISVDLWIPSIIWFVIAFASLYLFVKRPQLPIL